jgi:RNA polymerase sigma-70 factor (ECF subfamily)
MPEPPAALDYDAALAACALGDRGALRRLYDAEAPRLLGVVMRIVRERQQAQDIVHDAFVKIWHKAGSFDAGRGSGRGWMYVIARHEALNAVRRRAHEVAADASTLERIDAEAAEADEAGDEAHGLAAPALPEDIGPLKNCLDRLDAGKRSSIVLAYVDGCSHSEIAERLQTPLGTVKAWIRRGLQSLRECMG